MRKLVSFLVVALLVVAGFFTYYANSSLTLPRVPLAFDIKPGSSLKSAARQLVELKVLPDAWRFVWLARLLGKAGSVKTGNYEIEGDTTPFELITMITRGKVSQGEIVLIEGWNFREVRAALNAHPNLRHDSAALSDAEILQRVGAAESHPEGLFFPDTYYFAKGSSDLAVLRRAYRVMQNRLSDAWAQRAPDVPFATPYEALIMASIVEKETGQATERPMIAAVFVNRLRHGMRLQTDPTVIYGLSEKFDGNLRRRDLETDTPYNSYTRAGLPPTPIAMPGMDALRATLNPAQSRALYFVARGDGTSKFSESLAEHNRAVTQYQLKGGK
ncbi:MAG: endolytic transglycosylase MltG [Pseudomonadota bacterium]